MSIIKRNNLLFPSFMDEFFTPDWFGGMETSNGSVPAVNIMENEKDFELELAIPGFKKGDFSIEVDENVLTISSDAKSENEKKDSNYKRREFSYTSFKRAFTLSETIDEAKINAYYDSGILRLTLPKREEALPKPKRLIEIA